MTIICWGNLAKSADDTQRIEQSIQAYIASHDEDINAHMGEEYALGAHRLQTTLDHPDQSINYWHIKDVHAESITSGRLLIKGNGPYISVQDEADNERVKIYPEGIIVKGGRISVQNEGNEEIIDGTGLRGSNIFYSHDSILEPETQITGANKWYMVPNLYFGIYMKRATPALVFGNIPLWFQGIDNQFSLKMQVNNDYIPEANSWFFQTLGSWERKIEYFAFTRIIMLNAGSNFIALHHHVDSLQYTAGVSQNDQTSNLGYVVLGN
jgi:hypothetical protein